MINASLDTTAAAMQWTLCLAAQCTAAQERLRQELVLASIGRTELPVEEAELEVGIVIRPGGDLRLIATRLDCR